MIKLSVDEHVAIISLDQAPVNAINDAWLESFEQVLDQLQAHEGVSVVHLRSAHKIFCAGADLNVMRDLLTTSPGRDRMIELIRRMQRLFFRLEKLPVVTVAEIGGAALGGGLELALACDFRIAADNAMLGLPEARHGLLPAAGGTQRLPRICGEAIARRLILGAEVVDGEQAARLGLVQWVMPADQLVSGTEEIVQRLGSLPAQALASCKACLGAAFDDSVDGYERELLETRKLHDEAETQRRVQAFLEKIR